MYLLVEVPVADYDLICVGTRPDSHLVLAAKELEEEPRALLIEKRNFAPDLVRTRELFVLATGCNTDVIVGYDHIFGKAAIKSNEMSEHADIGEIDSIDAEFCEHWGRKFTAHSWLDGPKDNYLGHRSRRGGALDERPMRSIIGNILPG